MKTLIYLHGFNSSPQSFKAKQTVEFIAAHFSHLSCLVPTLPISPSRAIKKAKALMDSVAEPVLIGSSLGGFYANYLVEQSGCKAVLVNPAVYPYDLLQAYLGPQSNQYTGESYTLGSQDMVELRDLAVAQMKCPANRYLLLQTADETLDFSQASDYFSGCKSVIEYGGDHSFQKFERWLPSVAEFLALD